MKKWQMLILINLENMIRQASVKKNAGIFARRAMVDQARQGL